MFVDRKIILLLLCLPVSHAWADAAEKSYAILRSPAMAAFYRVSESGRSVREVVDVVVIAVADAKPSVTVVGSRPKPSRQAPSKKLSRATITIKIASKRHDSFAAFRCERYGFYYTNRGDCIAPAASHRNSGHRFAHDKRLVTILSQGAKPSGQR